VVRAPVDIARFSELGCLPTRRWFPLPDPEMAALSAEATDAPRTLQVARLS